MIFYKNKTVYIIIPNIEIILLEDEKTKPVIKYTISKSYSIGRIV